MRATALAAAGPPQPNARPRTRGPCGGYKIRAAPGARSSSAASRRARGGGSARYALCAARGAAARGGGPRGAEQRRLAAGLLGSQEAHLNEGHADVEAVLGLPEVGGARVAVDLGRDLGGGAEQRVGGWVGGTRRLGASGG
jgi:hypothetical protein